MPGSQWQNFKAVVRKALRAPFSVALLSLGLLFAALMHDLPGVAILGGTAAAVVVYIFTKLRDEDFIRQALRDQSNHRLAQETQDRTFRIEELDVENRVRMKGIIRLQNEIAQYVADTPVNVLGSELNDAAEQTGSVTDRALELAQQRRQLQRYLTVNSEQSIQARIRNLTIKLDAETDPASRAEIEKSIEAKQQELEDYRAIEQTSARILDELESIECFFSGLRAKLVLIKSSDIDEWVSAREELCAELGKLNTTVDMLRKSINEALIIGRIGEEPD